MNPGVFLHLIVLIIILILPDGSPGVGRNHGIVIFKQEIDIYRPIYSVYASLVGGLPHRRPTVCIHGTVPGYPDIIVYHRQIDFAVEPRLVGIHHRVVAGRFYLPAECVDHFADLGRCQCPQRPCILRVKGNRK